MKFSEILSLLKEKQSLRTEEEVWIYLRMRKSNYYEVKSGRTGLNDEIIERLMEGTGLEAVTVVAAWEADFSPVRKVRGSWKRFLRDLRRSIENKQENNSGPLSRSHK